MYGNWRTKPLLVQGDTGRDRWRMLREGEGRVRTQERENRGGSEGRHGRSVVRVRMEGGVLTGNAEIRMGTWGWML